MTNREKFRQVFGIDVKWSEALSPQIPALRSIQLSGVDCAEEWLNRRYVTQMNADTDALCDTLSDFNLDDIYAAIDILANGATKIDSHDHYSKEEEEKAISTALTALLAIKLALIS